ncbi:hypothetical protein MMC11_007296 [Xylographa trunciseda]|nr:hypothetical protein [Xylographa trunciseda]
MDPVGASAGAINKQPVQVSSPNINYAKAHDSSSDESETDCLYTPLTDEFEEVVSAFEEIIGLLRSESSVTKGHLTDKRRQANVLSKNLLSMVLTWACDVRIEGGYLNNFQDTIIGFVVRTSLGQIGFQLRSLILREYEAPSVTDLNRLLNSDFQKELLDSISSLQSQVKAIRMSQATKHGLGPLDGLARNITWISGQHAAPKPVIEPVESLEPISKGSLRPPSYREALLSVRAKNLSSVLPPVLAVEYSGRSKLDPQPQSARSRRLVTRRTASELLSRSSIWYEHMKIDPKSNIRLLILSRGTEDDKLECSMTIVPSVGHQLQYTAISHAWAPAAVGGDIWIRNTRPLKGLRSFRNVVRHVIKYKGFLTAYKFPLSPGIYSALRQFRREDQDLELWVDEICIDGHDLHEPNMQFMDMADIFHGAEKVSVWLGEGNEDSDTAISFIQEKMDPIRDLSEIALARKAWVHCGTKSIEWIEFSSYVERIYIDHTRLSELLGPLWENRLYQSDSINRLATSPASVFVRAVKDIFDKTEDGVIIDARLSLEYLVCTLSRLEVSDPRDTIYAFLSDAKDTRAAAGVSGQIETKESNSILRPDYRKNYLEVCVDFVRFCIESSRSLDIICRPWARDTELDFPSWISPLKEAPFDTIGSQGPVNSENLVGMPGKSYYNTSFSIPVIFGEEIQKPGLSMEDSRAKGSYYDKMRLANILALDQKGPSLPQHSARQSSDDSSTGTRPGCIRVTGRVIDTIMEVSPRIVAGLILRECLELSAFHVRTVEGASSVPEWLWRTLVADRDHKGHLPPNWYKQACFDALHHVDGNGDLDTNTVITKGGSPLVSQYLERVRRVTWNRRLTRTGEKGLLGLVPANAKHSDLVCVLYGCSVPVILRPMVGLGDCFQLIGECFIHGIMEGQAVRDMPRASGGPKSYRTFEIR